MTVTEITWGYFGSDASAVCVTLVHDGGRREDIFDVTLYDVNEIDPVSGRNCQDQSLFDLRYLLGLANAAIKAGLDPEPVPDKQ
jgi:hypothetical protein